jgi:hypothetical protein
LTIFLLRTKKYFSLQNTSLIKVRKEGNSLQYDEYKCHLRYFTTLFIERQRRGNELVVVGEADRLNSPTDEEGKRCDAYLW